MGNQKVHELDSRLSGVIRIREHEKENNVLLSDTVEKELNLCLEDMEKDFREKVRMIENRIGELSNKNTSYDKEVRELQIDIKNIGPHYDQEARIYIDKEKEIEDRRRVAKQRELEGKFQGVESTKEDLARRNEDYLRRIQEMDTKQRQNLMT